MKKLLICILLIIGMMIPVHADGQHVDNQLINVAGGTQMNIATMNTEDNAVFFPVYTKVKQQEHPSALLFGTKTNTLPTTIT